MVPEAVPEAQVKLLHYLVLARICPDRPCPSVQMDAEVEHSLTSAGLRHFDPTGEYFLICQVVI